MSLHYEQEGPVQAWKSVNETRNKRNLPAAMRLGHGIGSRYNAYSDVA